MRETERKKLTPLGWIIILIMLAVFLWSIYLWIVPHIEIDPIGTIIRVVISLAIFAVIIAVVKKLGGKRMFRE